MHFREDCEGISSPWAKLINDFLVVAGSVVFRWFLGLLNHGFGYLSSITVLFFRNFVTCRLQNITGESSCMKYSNFLMDVGIVLKIY